ncbi:LysM peptidoglycan-binding domain-containing protein [Mucilaginibacter sp. ZT4R22]|uniref:LysM peptidoglycan-binding domain-containing protein n=1 Tax=Mucilaginibacter pankratovii TaxID=2772110 RepID=A0ABR7WME6_9SPHI|nr:LysM peptidoglycan-binding domain-containing protein [Mucilaginibacter pankratovii]MBD1362492.1 LysM peptidoglycan-binding domain-containing protein [Mucilaginibacter pankratovii]
MKLKILLVSTIFLTLSASLFARPLVDSIGVENLNGKKVILHKLDPKDNYYSIGRKYGVSPKAIIEFNSNASMQIGKVIKVPTERPFSGDAPASAVVTATPAQQPQTKPVVQQPVTTTPPVNTPVVSQQVATTTPPAVKPAEQKIEQKTAQEVANSNVSGITVQQYKVGAGETLYSIAKRFGTTVDDITATNKLTSTIVPGQVLTIRSGVPATPPPPPPVAHPVDTALAKRDSTYVASPADSLADKRAGASKYGLFEKNEKGVATWIDDASLDPNKKLILHRTAPIGTVMRITNPMTGKSTFAKVVGRFTDNQSTQGVMIVMTKNVAETIGAIDKRFHVTISYGTPNE